MSACRSCGAPIRWALTERGRRIPLDPEPYTGPEPSGLFRLNDPDDGLVPTAITVPPGALEADPVYRSHFATCSDPERHRKLR